MNVKRSVVYLNDYFVNISPNPFFGTTHKFCDMSIRTFLFQPEIKLIVEKSSGEWRECVDKFPYFCVIIEMIKVLMMDVGF